MGLWGAFMEAIPAYTGLSPVVFFTLLALLVGVYHLVSGLFAAPPAHVERSSVPMQPIAPPVQLGEITEEELRAYDGSDPKKPLLMAIKGQIYDVTQSRMFYGPGGPYALFAGKDASRALAKMSFEEKDLTSDIEGLSPFELEALQDWEYKFTGKYDKVGQIITKGSTREVEVTGATFDNATEAENNVSEQKAREGAVDAESIREAKENGAVPKEDVIETGENATDSEETKENAVEINEAIQGAPELKKTEDIVDEHSHAHEHSHSAGVAAE